MKTLLVVLFVSVIVFVSGCVSQDLPLNNGNGNGVVETCQSDYISGGSMISNPDNYNTTCKKMCSDKFKIDTYRIDKKTDSFAMCYCDINEC